MVLSPDEAANSGAGFQMLMQHSSNQIQLKLNYAATGYLYLSLYNNVQGTLVNQRLDAVTLGINQYATNEWFHLAFTYNGTDTGKIYWTKLGDDYTGSANELVSFPMIDLTLADATLSFGGNANLAGAVFNGAIDEIRISGIARPASSFLKFPYTNFEEWIAGFGLGSATNATDNPDNDALNNLYEFGLGGDPGDS